MARNYLLELRVRGLDSQLLEKYLHFSERAPRPASIALIYRRLLESAQNANMKAGVIGGAIGGVDKLGSLLCDFQPAAVLDKYHNEWNRILDDIVEKLRPRGKIRRTERGLWPKYCRTILSGARFLAQFSTVDDFYGWVDVFDNDDRVRTALPLLLSREISGFGLALSCDFLKELGYANFAKPDVHLCDIFIGLALCPEDSDDYEVLKAVVRVARNCGVKPYNVDKLFWLIGSGNFYGDPQIGESGRIGNHKKMFIAFARRKLRSLEA